MSEGDEPPDDGEPEPGEDEAEGKHDEGPPPLGVHEGGEDVLKEAQPALGDARLQNIALAVLEDCAPPDFAHAPETVGAVSAS